MNCTNCAAPLEHEAKFCGECGQPVIPASSASLPSSKCSNCGADIEVSFLFCGECGEPVMRESIPEPAAIEPPPEEKSAPTIVLPADTTPPPPQMKPPPVLSPTPRVIERQAEFRTPPQQPLSVPAPQPAAPARQDSPKKSRTGCIVAVVVVVMLLFCCVASGLIGWYILDNISLDILPGNLELPILDRYLNGNTDMPPLDWFLGDQTAIAFENASGEDVCLISITPSNGLDFSEDVLGEDVFLYAGDTFETYIESWQSVDIMALDCFGETLYESEEVYLSGEDILITISPP